MLYSTHGVLVIEQDIALLSTWQLSNYAVQMQY